MDGLLVLALISFLAERGCIWQLLVQSQVVITHRIQIEGRLFLSSVHVILHIQQLPFVHIVITPVDGVCFRWTSISRVLANFLTGISVVALWYLGLDPSLSTDHQADGRSVCVLLYCERAH